MVKEFTIIGSSTGTTMIVDYAKAEMAGLSRQHSIDMFSSIISPENKTYSKSDIPLIYSVYETVASVSYCLDGQTNMTVYGNTTLPLLMEGSHS